jgi:two-component system LytT family response regulator
MEPLQAVLIDDESSSLENLQQKLQEFCPSIRIVATTKSPEDAISLIRQHKPDVVFLDIEMPRMSGFKVLEELSDLDFEVIFITAYNHYAIEAIRISAFDYLVKPVAIKELISTVDRLVGEHRKLSNEKFEVLRQNLSDTRSQDLKIAIPSGDGIEFMPIKNIIRIEASSNYSRIVLTSGKTMLVAKLLKEFEEMLLKYGFYRVHNSHLINLSCISKYIRGDGGQIVMQNGDIVDVSRRKKDEFLQITSLGI